MAEEAIHVLLVGGWWWEWSERATDNYASVISGRK